MNKQSIIFFALITLFTFPSFAESPLGTAEMATANRAAAKILKRKMKSERPNDAALLEEVKSAEIIVVEGHYDRVQDVLGAVDIKLHSINLRV